MTDTATGLGRDKRLADPGEIWVCAACGKSASDRWDFYKVGGDESCSMNAVLCHDDKPPVVSGMQHKWRAIECTPDRTQEANGDE